MTPQQKQMVHDSCRLALKKRDDFGDFFYACLFDIAPEMKPLFRSDIEDQAHRFMSMVSLAVVGLKDNDTISPGIDSLGRQHRAYKIRPEHYESFGRALIWSLDQTLGGDFTPELRRAWQSWYELVAQTMAGAMCQPHPQN